MARLSLYDGAAGAANFAARMRRQMSDHSKVYGFGEIRFTESAKVGPSVSYVGPLASTIDVAGKLARQIVGGAGHLVREIAPLNRQS
jgi:hypothetical protein